MLWLSQWIAASPDFTTCTDGYQATLFFPTLLSSPRHLWTLLFTEYVIIVNVAFLRISVRMTTFSPHVSPQLKSAPTWLGGFLRSFIHTS